eukprot:TRINITY_DN25390_c0_g1_i2.p1 TRINITY_DN25390_c0_g1~~TRINITY_DN25390_c0_g1_i2.p1  ORF type:complete len:216 (+),score=37.14 TRINITY_DN25390_c0_g1_i2:433-1080(+)
MCVGSLPAEVSPELKKARRKGQTAADEPPPTEHADRQTADTQRLPVGRAACTRAVVIQHGWHKALPCSLVLLAPATGRRHQLRVHCATEWGHPIVGDLCYCEEDRSRSVPRMMLHAWRLSLPCDTRDTAEVHSAEQRAARKRMRKEKIAGRTEQQDEAAVQMRLLEIASGARKALDAPQMAEVSVTASGAPLLILRAGNRLMHFLSAEPSREPCS